MKIMRRSFGKWFLFFALFSSVIFASSLSSGAVASVDRGVEQYKIVHLLNEIGSSDLVFIRNGAEYTGEEAKAHLQNKLYYAGYRVRTAEDFIVYIASISSETGLPYFVRLADGTQMESGTWLRGKLAEIK